MKIGIFIWRMQPIHLWHERVINKSLEDNDLTFIILWSSWVIDGENNIYTDKHRKEFLQILLKKRTKNKILFIKDTQSEEEWVKNLHSLIEKTWEEYLEATLNRLLWSKGIISNDIQSDRSDFHTYVEHINFYCWDIKNDYAITIIQKYETLLNYKKIIYTQINRKDISINYKWEELYISSSRVREELLKQNFPLLEKMLHPKILAKIKKI